EMFDLIRLDHFRAFSAYWDVPAREQTARNGKWVPGPGVSFFRTVVKELGDLPFLAEDLGEIDEPVFKLRDEFHFPGMKILQFAFGEDVGQSDYIPHNYTPNFFVYTGTHDNNTVRGWYRQEADERTRHRLEKYTGLSLTEHAAPHAMARLAYASIAKTVILPLQDLLEMDQTARMNTPSSGKGNWQWRLLPHQLTQEAENTLKEWVVLYNRQ
ncbi:MAG TPA: 4-alpha-glucanotransferase, partial [Chitinophagaceae bacterium]|nr:4-alpha-glucanotransferase [Chitinophagaceae bacterium]